jgi:hypothetical protein
MSASHAPQWEVIHWSYEDSGVRGDGNEGVVHTGRRTGRGYEYAPTGAQQPSEECTLQEREAVHAAWGITWVRTHVTWHGTHFPRVWGPDARTQGSRESASCCLRSRGHGEIREASAVVVALVARACTSKAEQLAWLMTSREAAPRPIGWCIMELTLPVVTIH